MFYKIMFLLLISISSMGSQKMIVRVYTEDYSSLEKIKLKSLDIAGRKYNEYYDIVVTPEEYEQILSSGMNHKIVTEDIEKLKEQYRRTYHSYSEATGILRNYASNNPSICKLDSIGPSYEDRWVYVLKISDNPGVEEESEPGILFDGLHHSREWATVEVILFYADTLIQGYGTDPTITSLVDNNEVWLIPIVNPDGYVYDYPAGNYWRKNRKPYLGYMGTDLNRNYNGALNEDPHGSWCSVPSGASISNYPSSSTFCGAYSGWGDVVAAMMEFHRNHDINANISYHSYAEEIIWPWAYNTSIKTPDSTAYEHIAQEMASRIQALGGGNYVASGSLYPNTGTTRTWVYGFHHFVKGTASLSYTIEVGTSFYQDTSDLENIVHENWEGALFLALQADSIRANLLPEIPAPDFYTPDTVNTDTFSVSWVPVNKQFSGPDRWQLDHLENYQYSMDDIESGTSLWNLYGYTQSSARSYSGSYSLYSGSSDNIANCATTEYPYLVQSGDSLSFWCWYDIEDNYDVTVVEVSEDLNEWIQLDERYTGNSGGWVQKKYSLEPWVGKTIYYRFKTVTDDYTLEENFYVDDISPVPEFETISMLDSTITDTTYQIDSMAEGTHYFRVRGHNFRGWGNYSHISETYVSYSGISGPDIEKKGISLKIEPTRGKLTVFYSLNNGRKISIKVHDVCGRKIREINRIAAEGSHSITIDDLPSGIWFVTLDAGDKTLREKAIVIR